MKTACAFIVQLVTLAGICAYVYIAIVFLLQFIMDVSQLFQ